MAASHPNLWPNTVRLVALLILSWPIMLLTHETGHLLGGWLSGAKLKDYELLPWRLPYSIHDPNPHPLVTLWGGPCFGILAPLAVAIVFRRPWTWFIADFCMLANGLYLAAGLISSYRFLDATMLRASGTPYLAIAGYAFPTSLIGYWRFRRDCLDNFRETPKGLSVTQPTTAK